MLLLASGWFRSSSGTLWHIYRDLKPCTWAIEKTVATDSIILVTLMSKNLWKVSGILLLVYCTSMWSKQKHVQLLLNMIFRLPWMGKHFRHLKQWDSLFVHTSSVKIFVIIGCSWQPCLCFHGNRCCLFLLYASKINISLISIWCTFSP